MDDTWHRFPDPGDRVAGRVRRPERSFVGRISRLVRAELADQWRMQNALQQRLLELNVPWLAGQRPGPPPEPTYDLAA